MLALSLLVLDLSQVGLKNMPLCPTIFIYVWAEDRGPMQELSTLCELVLSFKVTASSSPSPLGRIVVSSDLETEH